MQDLNLNLNLTHKDRILDTPRHCENHAPQYSLCGGYVGTADFRVSLLHLTCTMLAYLYYDDPTY